MSSLTFRIVHINDVYEIDEFASLKTLYNDVKKGADFSILTLGGDFVAPSLLSGIDSAKGMIDVMNSTGVTHVCFGNHEADIPLAALKQRITEFKGKWLNTNMPGFSMSLPESDMLKMVSADGSNARTVALIGLLCHYPSLYKDNAFGPGAVASIAPVNDAAIQWKEKLASKVDLIVPMTHQSVADDRILGNKKVFPLILGGHDHEEYYEDYDGSILIKTGMDAHKAAVIDIVWENKDATQPKISWIIKTAKDYTPDPQVQRLTNKHKAILEALDKAVIYRHKGKELLTSNGTRLRQTTMGALICGAIRRALDADAVLLDGGGIRGKADYPNGKVTLSDIRKEMPFGDTVLVCKMQGKDIANVLKFSRSKEEKAENAGYLQADDGITVDAENNITHIKFEPFDPKKEYQVGFFTVSYHGMNNNTPLIEWTKSHSHPSDDAKMPSVPLVLSHFSKLMWKQLPPFEEIDVDGDKSLSVDEVRAAYAKVFDPDLDKDQVLSDVEKAAMDSVVDKLIECLNLNGDNMIDRYEYESGLGIVAYN